MRKTPAKSKTFKDILWSKDRSINLMAEISKFSDRLDIIDLGDVIAHNLNNINAVIVHANVGENRRDERVGLKWLQHLRLNLHSKIPVLVYSFEEFTALSKDFSIIKTPGIKFIESPFSINELDSSIEETLSNFISEVELNEITRWHCGLQEQWQSFSHRISGHISDYQNQHEKIKLMVDEWGESIHKFAADQKYNLENFRYQIQMPTSAVNTSDLRRLLEKLDDGLQNSPSSESDILFSNQVHHFPERPPKGFSKILIADDEPQDFLINSLKNEYGYVLVEPQAFKLEQAKSLLDNEKPDVVLSDYYFKRSERKTETPDKSVGDEFIFYALRHLDKPLVLVTSKTTLNSISDIRFGAVNCSGAMRATDPAFIHKTIWEEAYKRGVVEEEINSKKSWTLEHTCRQRLERYLTNIQNYINQWNEFGNIVCYTLRQAGLLLEEKKASDSAIVEQIIQILKPYETQKDFSIENIEFIFKEIENIHKAAKTAPDSPIKAAVRNLLHGYIEQFSSITNEIKFAQIRLLKIADELSSVRKQNSLAENLKIKLSEFDTGKQLASYLGSLKEFLPNVISKLPLLPVFETPLQAGRKIVDSRRVNIIVVEDNNYWKDFVFRAIEKVKSKLGGDFDLTYRHFNNAADGLSAIPTVNKSFAIDNTEKHFEQTIAVVDICLPENQAHAEKIKASYSGESDEAALPHSTHGLNLIRNLCDYKYNTPLIVFSTIDSLEDRLVISRWGVPQENFIAKGYDDETIITQALIRLIEKKDKYIIRIQDDENAARRFWINGFELHFPPELSETFSAFCDLSQSNSNQFSIGEIMALRGDSFAYESKKRVQDHINRIRKFIHEIFQKHHRYINTRNLIKTRKNQFNDEFSYELNAAITFLDENEDEADCRILVIENNAEALGQIIEPLVSLGYEVRFATNVEEAVVVADEFEPHIVSLDLQIPYTRLESESKNIGDEFAGLAAWDKIRSILPNIGVVVPTINSDKNYLVSKASQMEIPIRNFISKKDADWVSSLLSKTAQLKREVILGESTDSTYDFDEPVIEILDGSNLEDGLLRLIVNGESVKIKKGSSIAKVLGILLAKPGVTIDFDEIKGNIGGTGFATKDEKKGWTRKIRNHIRDNWIGSQEKAEREIISEKVLERTNGLRLNAQVIDLRMRPQN